MSGNRNEERLVEQLAARFAGCPPADELQAYAAADDAAPERIAEHVAGCGACGAALDLLELEDETQSATALPREIEQRSEEWIAALTGGKAESGPTASRPGVWSWGIALAAAAALVLLVVLRPPEGAGPIEPVTDRGEARTAIATLAAEDVPLPRDAFVLRWSAPADAASYEVRVLSSDLSLLYSARVSKAELRVPESALAPLGAGETVYWQVAVTLPDGSQLTSVTFVALVE